MWEDLMIKPSRVPSYTWCREEGKATSKCGHYEHD